MATSAKENAQWRRGKSPVISEYLREKEKMESVVAGRNFTHIPGFAYRQQTFLELGTKQKLSELNFKILEETISQELKKAGLEYELAHKNAAIAWELKRQALFSDLEKEIAHIKKGMSDDEEALKRLAIEVSKRENDIREQKTIIELQAEAYRKAIAGLDNESAEYEVQLARAKVRTAEKKLEIIPYLEQLITLEGQLIGKEQEIVLKNQILVEKNEALLEKDELLLDKQSQLIQKNSELLTAERKVLDAQADLLEATGGKVAAEEKLIETETDLALKRITLLEPAITALLAVYEDYINELAVQTELVNQITDVKTQTASIRESILEKVESILEKQRVLSQIFAELTARTGELAEYRIEKLGQVYSDLVGAYRAYKIAIEEQIELERQILDVKKQTAGITMDRADLQIEILAIETAIEKLQNSLVLVQNDIRTARLILEKTLIRQNTKNTRQVMEAETRSVNAVDSADIEAKSTIESLKIEAAAIRLAARLASVIRLDSAEKNINYRVAFTRADEEVEKAEISAATKISAELVHLLSQ